MQTALVRSEMVCPGSREIGTIDVITDDFRRSTVVPALVGILACTLALALAVGLLLLLTVRFRQGTPTHNLLSERLQRLVLSDRRRNGKGARARPRACMHARTPHAFTSCSSANTGSANQCSLWAGELQ